MRRNAGLVLLLPLLTFGAYVAYHYVSSDGTAWNPLPALAGTRPATAVQVSDRALSATPVPNLPTHTLAASSTAPMPSATRQSTSTPTRSPTPRPTVTLPNSPTAASSAASPPTSLLPADEAAAGLEVGERLLASIEDFNRERGAYPITLADLVPDYLTQVPQTPSGQPFAYRSFAANEIMASEAYWLAFALAEQPGMACTYYRRLDHWDCHASLLMTAQ